MTPSGSAAAFRAFAAAYGIELTRSTPRDGLERMFAFYESTRAAGCDGPDGDMLLFQWGTYDWGEGRFFEIGITRQFIEQGIDEDDDVMSQLSLTYRFEPTPAREALGDGNRWCNGVEELPAFRSFVLSCAPFVALADTSPLAVVLDHGYV